ncbi:2-dehydropantoate 2-reductase [Nadsonia fulvescens var. elongata DSM 6958]|uniref:2-dehydropantoate 2-reductase n=1 Tax=Nadsonia fulvescens var. elongata DSM 6958 TaxID=857566 RepID=A0A1E3PNI2_9ASCO|nr:2-dehydropantoate 2-reductase [Nadsonia fulvescens var. elongata DSM 6958]
MTIHILGAGNIGSLVAYAASQTTAYSPVLLLRNKNQLSQYIEQSSSSLIFDQLDSPDPVSTWVDAASPESLSTRIDNLVVTTKTYQTVPALQPWIEKLTPSANILFLQNGMGSVDAAISVYWPEISVSRPQNSSGPRIYVGVTTHGVFRHQNIPNDFSRKFTHAGIGDLKFAHYRGGESPTNSSNELESMLTAAPALNGQLLDYQDLIRTQYQKLIANCCINPLTTMLDCPNGKLNVSKTVVESLYPAIVKECVQVINRHFQLAVSRQGDHDLGLDYNKMLEMVYQVAHKTGANSSSMRQDMSKIIAQPKTSELNLQTEIDYINGWIVANGRLLGVPTPVNTMLLNMIKAKSEVIKSR